MLPNTTRVQLLLISTRTMYFGVAHDHETSMQLPEEHTEFIAHLRLDSRIAEYIIKVQ